MRALISPTDVLMGKELHRQHVKGFTTEHDLRHTSGELIPAARSYLLADAALWPWADTTPTFGPRDLIKAAALLKAEQVRQVMVR